MSCEVMVAVSNAYIPPSAENGSIVEELPYSQYSVGGHSARVERAARTWVRRGA